MEQISFRKSAARLCGKYLMIVFQVNNYNVLFIDNPVGTGFSYVDSLDVLAKTNSEIAKDLLACIAGFFKNITIFANTPTYIMAQSYGGKMGVEFANLWYKVVLKKVFTRVSSLTLVDALLTAPFVFKRSKL